MVRNGSRNIKDRKRKCSISGVFGKYIEAGDDQGVKEVGGKGAKGRSGYSFQLRITRRILPAGQQAGSSRVYSDIRKQGGWNS